tara:strand:+ start:371 stop:673 length:303 start_codon:yes stop_codon:yes gene_type:complete
MKCNIILETEKEVRIEMTLPPRIRDSDTCALNGPEIAEALKASGLIKEGWKCIDSPSYMSNIKESRRTAVCVYKKPPALKVKKPSAPKKRPEKVRKSDTP